MDKKIAVFHNFMDNIGGAEIVTLFLAREFKADIYTTNINPDKIGKMGFGDVLPRIISLGRVPTNAPFRHQLAFWKFRRLNLGSKYDFYIISGDWAMSGAVNNKPNLWYVHSPLNELWAWKPYIENQILKPWQRPLFNLWVAVNRMLSLRYAKSVGAWACNSTNSKNRIRKFYGKEATVIYPPIDAQSYQYKSHKNYWLSVNRLLKYKRVDVQLQAFAKLPNEKLVIVGSYEKGARQFESYKKYIEKIKPANVEIISWADSEKLKQLYSECKGFITTAIDEDFGMTSLEAMASGKPVIAPNEGGYKETVVDGKTGVLIDNITSEKLANAVAEISRAIDSSPDKYKCACQARAKNFDLQVFVKKIIEFINA